MESSEMIILLGAFACGTLAGALSRYAPLSGWAALVFSVLTLPVGVGLARLFC